MDWADMANAEMEREHARWEKKALRCNACGEILNLDKYFNELTGEYYCRKCLVDLCMDDNDLIDDLVNEYVDEWRETV